MGQMEGKKVFLTGASKGMGREMARGLAKEGATLALVSGCGSDDDDEGGSAPPGGLFDACADNRVILGGVRPEHEDGAGVTPLRPTAVSTPRSAAPSRASTRMRAAGSIRPSSRPACSA